MNKNTNNILIILILLGFCFVAIAGVFIVVFTYSSEKDVSTEAPYAKYLNRPVEIKHVSTLRWNRERLRFSNYTLNHNEDSDFDLEDVKSVKHYQPGDRITFHSAKKYSSMHIGDTYYLIGRDTLNNGEPIEFEYHYQDKYYYNIWETEEEYLERIKNLNELR